MIKMLTTIIYGWQDFKQFYFPPCTFQLTVGNFQSTDKYKEENQKLLVSLVPRDLRSLLSLLFLFVADYFYLTLNNRNNVIVNILEQAMKTNNFLI